MRHRPKTRINTVNKFVRRKAFEETEILINFILPLRVSAEDEMLGLDATQHDEKYLQGTLLVKQEGSIIEQEIGLDSSLTREIQSTVLENELHS